MNGQHHGGKGSAQRSVDAGKFESNWDNIFGKKKAEPTARLTNYLVMLENRQDTLEDITSFLIEAENIMAAHKQMEHKKEDDRYRVYIESVNSIWLHNNIRKASMP